VGLKLVAIGLDNVEQNGEAPGPHVQLAAAYNTGQLKEDGEPALDPDAVHRRGAAGRLVGGVGEELLVGGDELGGAADETDGLHAGVGEESIARELGQALDAVLR
jgi:hypothetical protein